MTVWIRDPLGILAKGAERGIVVTGDRIVELIPRGAEPVTPFTTVFDAGRHVVLPALIDSGAGHDRPDSATQCGCEGSARGIKDVLSWLIMNW
jgi:hypothetical protein